jgi:hypothetical protein
MEQLDSSRFLIQDKLVGNVALGNVNQKVMLAKAYMMYNRTEGKR